MTRKIIYISFKNGSAILSYSGKEFTPEDFVLHVPIMDYDYIVRGDVAGHEEELADIVCYIDECFERLAPKEVFSPSFIANFNNEMKGGEEDGN